ncbi:efflux RND transporter periplasmic adaptor subunit [Marinobacter orientalis]|uniref:Efflux RND transporter periplasmic adaptor subunit n=1 Tax=Marinobacter orientalis TaxID=1928859 RepID=A0A7Y0RBE0_9GAMM|nr:efflux RND transporter periplasmic adaptor subunit [Marinobacter orientalis]NMT63124.1 efflux RND transporter periplasmic adaptor subunit [Marinobacter orientalis]TGX51780.1 efflux RND transporter periplasmic adaptor subunit [Marinobacter orientalis]
MLKHRYACQLPGKQPGILLALIVSLSFIAGCSEPVDAPQSPPVAVSVMTVESAEVRPSREFVARTAPSARADISARIEGEIREISFREGSRVEQGQLLVRLEDTSASADLRQAEAELAASRAELQSATRNLQRGEEVAGKGFLSAADLDKLKDRFSAAEGRLQAAEAAVQKASNNLAYTEIRAPFGGWVGKLNFDVGAVVGPASGAITEMLVTDPIYVEFQLNEAEYVAFRRAGREAAEGLVSNLSLYLTLPDGERYSQGGVMDFANVSTDATTGTVAMRAVFPNSAAVLVPGLYVNLYVEGQAGEARILVPQVAVQETIEGKFVLVVDDQQQVAQRFIRTGSRQGAMVVAEAGLEAGERVIVEGMQKVRTGVTVDPLQKRIDPDTGVLADAEEVSQ